MNALVEIDVTNVLIELKKLERQVRKAYSLHTYLIICLSKSITKHPELNTYRKGNNLITFNDIDILSPIDRRLNNGSRIPVGQIFRSVQSKNMQDINHELREALRSGDLGEEHGVIFRRTMAKLPYPVRKLIALRFVRDPFLFKKIHGTVLLTNLISRTFKNRIYGFSGTVHTLTVAIGSLTDRVCQLDIKNISARKMLCVTITVDHDIVDGSPLREFVETFTKEIESCAEILNLIKENTSQ